MTFINSIRTGGDIDAFCSRCDLNLAHTIIAMVGQKVERVKCNTCDAEHKYRGTQPLIKTAAAPAASRVKSSTPRPVKTVVSFEDQFKGKDLSRAKKYNIREVFADGDVVDHPTFGLGLVTAVRGDKVQVAFKLEEKTLVHAKAAPPSA